jgi:hypothetical protein
MARDQALDDDELELDEEGFAGPTRAARQAPKPGGGNGGNGEPWRRGGNGDEDAQAELARLRAENARLRAVAGLEARRDEPATVGDLLDANQAQADYIRSEVERAVEERGDEIADYVAECVERRLLEPLGLADENDDEDGNGGGSTKRKPSGKTGKTAKKRRGLRKGELFYEADGSGPFVFGGDEDDEVDDDGRRHAFD